ncbi:MAG: protein kinase [Planctomycetota bacterium]
MDDQDRRLGQLAVAQNFITAPQLQRAEQRQTRDGLTLGDALVAMGFVTRVQADRLRAMANGEPTPSAANQKVLVVRPISATTAPTTTGTPGTTTPGGPGEGPASVRPVGQAGAAAGSAPIRVKPLSPTPPPPGLAPTPPTAAANAPVRVNLVPTPAEAQTGMLDDDDDDDIGDGLISDERHQLPPDAEPADASASESAAAIADLVAHLHQDDDDGMVGREFAGCEVLGRVGEGGMGAIYRVRHLFLNKQLALKLLAPELTEESQTIQRFLREARSAAQLNHPNIVRIHDVGEAEGRFYILMEYVEGHNLGEVMQSQGRLSNADSMYVVKEVTRALMEAHAHGIVHRDIKPDNIMLDGARIKVTDFGLAKRLRDRMGLTMPGQIVGSPYFMAPEQGDGGMVDERVDIYSLGATWYYMVTGEYPFKGDNPMAVVLAHSTARLEPPRHYNATIPQQMEALILRMMERDRDRRPGTAQQLMAELDALRLREKSSFEALAEDGVGSSSSGRLGAAGSGSRGLSQARKKTGTFGNVGNLGTGGGGSASRKKRRRPTSEQIIRKPVSSTFMPLESRSDLTDPDTTPLPREKVVVGDPSVDVNADTQQAISPFGGGSGGANAGVAGGAVRSRTLSPEQQAEADATVDEVNKLLADGKLDDAKSRVQRALGRFPLHDGLQKARANVEQVVRKREVETLLEEAAGKLKLGEGGQAEQVLNRVLQLDPGSARALKLQDELATLRARLGPAIEKGLALIADNKLDEATRIFEAVIKVDPSHRVATIQLRSIDGRRTEAAAALARAVDAAEQGEMDLALREIAKGLDVIPDEPQLLTFRTRVEEKHAALGLILGEAKQLARSGKWSEATKEAAKALEIQPGLPEVQALREQWRDEAARYRQHIEAGKAAFEAADFVTAANEFQHAIGLNRGCEVSRKHLEQTDPIVAERNRLFAEGQQAAAEGRVHDALAVWQQIIDEVAPGDAEVRGVINEAAAHAKKVDRLEESATRAMRKKDFDTAIKSYRELLRLDSGYDEAREGLEIAERRKVKRARARRVRTMVLVLLLVCGAIAGGGYWLKTTNDQAYADAVAKMDAALQETDLAKARTQWTEARAALEGVRDSPISAIGLGPADIKDRIDQTRIGVRLNEGRSYERSGNFDGALAAWQELAAEGSGVARTEGEQGVLRIRLLRLARDYANRLASTREYLEQVDKLGDFADLGPNDATGIMGLIQSVLNATRDLRKLGEDFASHEQPAPTPGFELPTLETLSAMELERIEGLRTEHTILEAFIHALGTLGPAVTSDEWRKAALGGKSPEPDHYDKLEEQIERALRAVGASTWRDRYAPLLAGLRGWQQAVPVVRKWHEATREYQRAWEIHGNSSAPLEEVTAIFTRARDQAAQLRNQANDAARRPDIASLPGMADRIRRMAAWADETARVLGSVDQPDTVIGTLQRVIGVARSSAHTRLAMVSLGAVNAFVRESPVVWSEVAPFIQSGYRDPKYWQEYLTNYREMSAVSQAKVLESKFRPPTIGRGDAVVSGLSRFEIDAWMRWRAERKRDGARLPTDAELRDLFSAGFPCWRNSESAAVPEWTSSNSSSEMDQQRLPFGMLVLPDGRATKSVARDRSTREPSVFRLVYDFPWKMEAPPELTVD